MHPQRQLITLGDDGELTLKFPDGSLQELPQFGLQTDQAFVYLVIDCSGSMTGNKLEKSKNGALDFAQTAFKDGYSVGLISFNDEMQHLSSPINSISELKVAVNKLHASGGTDMSPSITEVINRFKGRENANLAMVVITDGQTSNPHMALKEAERAKQQNISILTIGTDDADLSFLSKLSSGTGLSKKVSSEYLQEAISDVAKMLPRG